jgi:hypothetical protein
VVTLQGAGNEQGTGIGVFRDQCGIVPTGDALALIYFDHFPFFRSIEDAGQ